MNNTNRIPFYTKIGTWVTTFVLIILGIVILRNCVSSVKYGTSTDEREIRLSYETGFNHGVKSAQGDEVTSVEPESDNPLLKKSYRQGFRQGWDSVYQSNFGNK